MHYLNGKIKKWDDFFFFFFPTGVQQLPSRNRGALPSLAQTWGSAKPSPLSRSPSSGAAPGLQAAIPARRGMNGRCAVALWIAGGTEHLSSHAPGWIATAQEWERSAVSAMMSTSSLTGRHGVLTPALRPAVPPELQRRSPGISHLGVGSCPAPACPERPADRQRGT